LEELDGVLRIVQAVFVSVGYGGKKATPFVLLVAFGYGLGSFLGPIFGGLAMSRFGDLWGIRITYWSICCVGVIVGLLLIPVRTPKQPSVRMEEAVRGKEQVTVSETPTVSLKEWKFPTCPENWWKIPKRNYIAIYLALHMFTYCIALLSFYGLIGSFVEGKGLCDAATASYLVSSYFIAFTFGRLVNVVVSAFVDARIIIFAFIFGAAIDAIVMISYSNNLLVIWVGTVFMGLFLAPQHPGVLAIPQQSLGVPLTGAMLSIITFGASVGEMVGPAISTSLLKVGLSWDVILWIGFICCSVCVILDLPMMVYLVIQIVKKRKNPIKINEKEIPKTTSQ
jgi:MFS family permease